MNAPNLRDIVQRIGAGDLYAGGSRALVPGPNHTKADRSLSLAIKGDPPRIVWWSHADDNAADVWRHLGLDGAMIRQETDAEKRKRQAEERAEHQRKMAFCADLWRETVPAEGTLAETYLRARRIKGEIPRSVRFHPAAPLKYPDPTSPPARLYPCMVAIATAADGKNAAGLHVTALKPDGSGKAAMGQGSARRMFGEFRGAAVQLGAFPADGRLAVAEGIETALAFRDLRGVTTWATLSTAGLKTFMPPAGISHLTIAADGDPAGIKAGRDLAERASRRCDVLLSPAPENQDWADALEGDA